MTSHGANEILRTHLIEAALSNLPSGKRIICVRGRPGSGKTTMLHQFANHESQTSIDLILNPLAGWMYTRDTLVRDIYTQARTIANLPLDTSANLHTGHLVSALQDLASSARISRKPHMILLDGVSELVEQQPHLSNCFDELLPWASPGFIIITTYVPGRPEYERATADLFVPSLTVHETRSLFDGFSITDNELKSIWASTRGVASSVVSARRLLSAGHAVADIAKTQTPTVESTLEFEWRATGAHLPPLSTLLGFLCFSYEPLTLDDLAQLSALPSETVGAALASCPFIEIDSFVTFNATVLRDQARDKLSHLRSNSAAGLAARALQSNDLNHMVRVLPDYLRDSRQPELFLQHTDADHMASLLSATGSMSALRNRSGDAAVAAQEVSNHPRQIFHQLIAAIVSDLVARDLDVQFVRSLATLGHHDAALAHALTGVVPETRLRLASVALQTARLSGGTISDENLQILEMLMEQSDPMVLTIELEPILSDLFVVSPRLASKLLDKCDAVGTLLGPVERRDWQIARASLDATLKSLDNPGIDSATPSLLERVNSPSARNMAESVLLIARTSTAEAILGASKEFDDDSKRIALLRRWVVVHARNADASRVANELLRMALSATSFSITATFLSDAAAPLRHVEPTSEAGAQLYARCIPHVSAARDNGPTLAYFQLKTHLASWLFRKKGSEARDMFAELLLELEDMQNIDDHVVALADLSGALRTIDPEKALEVTDLVHTKVAGLYKAKLDAIVASAALQDEILKPLLHYLVREDLPAAVELCGRLVSMRHRGAAALRVVNYAIRNGLIADHFDNVLQALELVADPVERGDALSSLIEALSSSHISRAKIDASSLARLGAMVNQLGAPSLWAPTICLQATVDGRTISADEIIEILNSAGDLTECVMSALRSATILGESQPATGRLLEYANEKRSAVELNGSTCERSYFRTCSLAIAAFAGVVSRTRPTDHHLAQLREMFDAIGSDAQRIDCWARVVVTVDANGHRDAAKKIAESFLWPIVVHLEKRDRSALASVCGTAAVALATGAPALLNMWRGRVDSWSKDVIAHAVSVAKLRGPAALERYDLQVARTPRISYGDCVAALQAAQDILTDWRLWGFAHELRHAVERSRSNLSKSQQRDVASQLSTLAEQVLPSPNGIPHDGYLIACLSEATVIDSSSTKSKAGRWRELAARAVRIPSTADSALVLTMIGRDASGDVRAEVFQQAYTRAKSIECTIDRIERLKALGELAWSTNRDIARAAIADAVRMISAPGSILDVNRRRTVVDLLYRLDASLAEELLSELDNDHAKQLARWKENAKKQHDLKESLSAGRVEKATTEQDARRMAEVCWAQLPRAAGGLAPSIDWADWSRRLGAVAGFALAETYPVYSLAIKSIVTRYGNADSEVGRLSDLFSLLVDAARLTRSLSRHLGGQPRIAPVSKTVSGHTEGLVVGDRQVEGARDFVMQWCEKQPAHTLTLIDPYFTLADFDTLHILAQSGRDIRILASQPLIEELSNQHEGFRIAVRETVRTRAPGLLTSRLHIVCVYGEDSMRCPIHDRWILSEDAGLRLGCSLNSLGHKLAEISYMTSGQAAAVFDRVEAYFRGGAREFEGERLGYEMAII